MTSKCTAQLTEAAQCVDQPHASPYGAILHAECYRSHPQRAPEDLARIHPRSGNTFLRCVLYNCFGLPSTSVHSQDLGNRRGLERFVGHFEADLPPPELAADKPLLVKTHRPPTDDAATIYIVRDGRPVSVSLWEFYRRRYPLRAVIAGNSPHGIWSNHLAVWRPWDRPNTLMVRYEDMIGDLPAVLQALSRFLDRPILSSQMPSRSELSAVGDGWVREYDDWRPTLLDETCDCSTGSTET